MSVRSMACLWGFLGLLLLAGCEGTSPLPTSSPTRAATALPIATATPTPTNTPTPTTPTRYTAKTLLQGVGHPDDLTFDQQGRLLFSDEISGTVSRLNGDGSVTVLLRGLAGPEGLVSLPDGTLLIAEQDTNRILSLAPGASRPAAIRTLPGRVGTANCQHGVDQIVLDPTNNTIIVPDSPNGNVYRMSLDGKTFTLLASGIVRPVGAFVDQQGTIYVADECGGAVWKITPSGAKTRLGGFGMPDDVAFDPAGNLLVIDLKPSIHALIRVNLATGKRETLASAGWIEPQGLLVDARGNIYVADDVANKIIEYIPA